MSLSFHALHHLCPKTLHHCKVMRFTKIHTVKYWFYVPTFWVFNYFRHFSYDPSWMSIRTMFFRLWTFLDFTPFLIGRHKNIKSGLNCTYKTYSSGQITQHADTQYDGKIMAACLSVWLHPATDGMDRYRQHLGWEIYIKNYWTHAVSISVLLSHIQP